MVNAAGKSRLVSGEVPSMRKGVKKVAIRKCFLVCCERVSSISNIWVAITENGKSGIELTAADFGAASGEWRVVRSYRRWPKCEGGLWAKFVSIRMGCCCLFSGSYGRF